MTEAKANAVYDLLVNVGGANEYMRNSFIYVHCQNKCGCDEWRFGGKLGFGGKYRSKTNTVDCYSEDETDKILCIVDVLNQELEKLK